MNIHLKSVIALAGALLPLAPLGQSQVCPTIAVAFEAWVDPNYGNDALGAVGSEDDPYRSLTAAIAALDAAGAGTTGEGLVRALPGLYSGSSNGELFPITMEPGIHLQGVGAKECVIRVRENDTPRPGVYLPFTSGPLTVPALVAVDYSMATGDTTPRLDGFTIQGAKVQVYAYGEKELEGVISNCIFDMRVDGAEALMGPSFGVLTVSGFLLPLYLESGNGYPQVLLHILNNTFIQGARYSANDVDVSIASSVAICDTTAPLGGDPDPRIRGENEHNIQNNLIRALDDFPRTSTLGIDAEDTSVMVAFAPAGPNTNAFDAGSAGSVSIDMPPTFASLILPGLGVPTPVLDLSGPDPGFVGEYHSFSSPRRIRDWRLLPDSAVIDLGATPLYDDTGCAGDLIAVNGTALTDTRGSVLSSFDVDCEGVGNDRIVGETVDVGADESDVLVIGRCFGNDTRSHNAPFDLTLGVDGAGIPIVPVGSPNRSYIVPSVGLIGSNIGLSAMTIPATEAWTTMPTLLEVPFLLPGPPQVAGSELWLDPLTLATVSNNPPVSFAPAVQWTNWESGQVHDFGEFLWRNVVEPFPATFATFQVYYLDLNSGSLSFDNSQSEFF